MQQRLLGKVGLVDCKKETVAIAFEKLELQGFAEFGGEIPFPIILA